MSRDPGDTDEGALVNENQEQLITNSVPNGQKEGQTEQESQHETKEQKQQVDVEDAADHGEPSQDGRHNEGVLKESGLPMSVDSIGDLSASVSSEESSLSDSIRNRIPRVNCPEKIIICLDLSPETHSVSFQSCRTPKRSILQLVQKAMSIFVKTKSTMNPDHEFGILVLDETVSWCQQFTNNVETICSVMNQLTSMEDGTIQEIFEMESLLDAVRVNIELPIIEDPALPPPYVVRLMLVYSRSLCQPCMSDAAKQMLCNLLASPYFFFDVFYVHELASTNNHCEATYDLFCDLDEDEVGYMLEVSRSTTRLYDHMAALLAHPLQRPKQRDTYYKITPRQEEETNL